MDGNAHTARLLLVMRRVSVEILVGFIGVYAAFALSAYKEKRDMVERRHQIKRALIAEIRDLTANAAGNASQLPPILARFDSTVAAGAPRPRTFVETVAMSDHVWEATKQAGGLNLIDVPTFVRLSAFYNMNSQRYAQYAQLRDLTITEIFPRLGKPPAAYYVPGTKELAPSFELYRAALKRLGAMEASMAGDGGALITELARDTI